MSEQNYSNHTQLVPAFHFVLLPVLLLTIIGAGVNLYQSWGDHERMYSASLIFVLAVCCAMLAVIARVFALRAQDRAIRAEENLRHLVINGKLLDPRLRLGQVIALRFASDGELVPLARRAAEEDLAPAAIKKAIKNWRGDFYRV